MNQLDLFVGLKIPDTTAITTFKTLKKLDFNINKIERKIYYKFHFDGDEKEFKEKITKVDILVNANKNNFVFDLKDFDGEKVIIKDIGDDAAGLLNTLKERLGLKEIQKIEKGVAWILDCDKTEAEKAVKELLFNENYQEYEFLD